MKKNIIVFFIILIVIAYFIPKITHSDERQDAYLYVARSLFEKGDYKKALSNFERAAELGELSSQDIALTAICYTKVKNYEKAKSLLTGALKDSPDDPLLLLAEGILNFDQKNYNTAYDYFSEAYKIDNSLFQAKRGMVSSLVNMGVTSYKEDKEKSKEYFLKTLKLDPSFGPALQNLAVLSFEEGKVEEAIDYINRELKYNPKNIKALELKYYIYYKQKDYKNQIDILLRLVILNPNNPEYWAMLGKAYEETGQYKKSIEAFKRARELNSSNPYPYYQLAKYYYNKKKDRKKALYTLREGIGKAIYLIGQIKVSAISELQGKKGKLSGNDIKNIERIAKSIEEPAKILENLINMLHEIVSDDNAYKNELASLIGRYPHTVELQVALADFYTKKGQYNKALNLWRYILVKHSRNIKAYKGIAYCYMKMGDTNKAIKSYKIALDIDPSDKTIYEQLIQLYLKNNSIKSLYKEWKERLYMDKRNPLLLRELARVEKILGMDKDAERHLRRAEVVERENREYEERQKNKEKE